MIRTVCATGVVLTACMAAPALRARPIKLDAPTLSAWETVRPQGATWSAKDGAWMGQGTDSTWWRMRVGGPPRAADYAVDVQLTIERPNKTGPFYCGPSFCSYWNGTRDGGYDAGVVARYTGKDYYRVQLSTRYQEVVLFKNSGGFVQVKPCTLKVGASYRVRVEVSGPRICAWVTPAGQAQPKDEPAIDYWDRTRPIAHGRAGVALYNSRVRFEKISLGSAAPCGPTPLRGPSRFTVRPWRGMKSWIFDHDEPIAHLDESRLTMWNAKLVPGYAPMGYWELFWKQYDGTHNYTNKLDELKVDEQGGPELRLHWVSHNEVPPKKFAELYPELKDKSYAGKPVRIVTNHGKLVLTHDPAANTYVYAVDVELVVDKDRHWKDTADGLEYCNLIPYNVVAPSVKRPDAWPWAYQWVLVRTKDNKVLRHPLHHNGVPRVYPRPDGGFYCYGVGEVINPTTEFFNPTDPKLKPYAGLCAWAYDIHFRYLPYTSRQIIPTGTRHRASYRVLNYDAAKVKKLFDQSELDPRFHTKREYAAFVWGLNDFKLGRRYAEPHVEWAWGGTWDKAVGHGDAFSIRIENKKPGVGRASHTGGSSFFMPRYQPGTYECSGWVKTRDVKGKGATLYVYNGNARQRHHEHAPLRITGTQDWTRVSFHPTKVAGPYWHTSLGLELDGTGTAWFDDVELKRIGPAKPAKKK